MTCHDGLKVRKAAMAVALLASSLAYTSTVSASNYAQNPPSWMPMTMAMITLDSAGALHMVDQSAFGPRCPGWSSSCFSSDPIPLAINVFSSGNPDLSATSFAQWDPAQPWSVLQNKAFSRQFGWWAGSGSAAADLQFAVESAYGSGASIWIELLEQSAGLETYKAVGRYGVNSDNTAVVDPSIDAYAGLFGTGGSPMKWQWDYQMDHNVYAVDLDSHGWGGLYSATYKVYIGDFYGNEIEAALGRSTIETWTWAAPVPEPGTYAMFFAGLGLIGALARRRSGV